jgi:four helix bundle protein
LKSYLATGLRMEIILSGFHDCAWEKGMVCLFMNSYRDLEIYIDSKRLGIEIHIITLTLPKFELYETGSQIRRSSKSVTAMIVEGFARRRYKADFVKYLIFAIAECDETLVHLDYLYETQSWKDANRYQELREGFVYLSKRINNFTQWVEENYVWKPN